MNFCEIFRRLDFDTVNDRLDFVDCLAAGPGIFFTVTLRNRALPVDAC